MEAENTLEHDAKRAVSYSVGEEIANAVTHGIGAALAIAALTALVIFAALYGDGFHLASSIVYGLSMTLLYTSSTLYHALPNPRAKHVFKIFDHSSIYLLIAGSYTPFTLVTLRNAGGWWIFGLVWGIALAGVAAEAFWLYRPKAVTAIGYIAMGWIIMLKIKPLLANLDATGVWLLVGGGVAYTGGTAFYVLKKVRYMHAVWHLFVLAGSVLHFLAVMLYVLPSGR